MITTYLRLVVGWRGKNLNAFCDKHDQLFKEALKTGDHAEAVSHYYDMMGSLIAAYYGDGWHFAPPEFKRQKREDSMRALHLRMGRLLELNDGCKVLDVGSGVGGITRRLAKEMGSECVGLTMSSEEVRQGNELTEKAGLAERCSIVQGDCLAMPFEEETFNRAYAIYALKYYRDMHDILAEVHRVLEPEGMFAAYCLCRSNTYDDSNEQHKRVASEFEYACAMPTMHTEAQIIQAADDVGLELVSSEDISTEWTWYHHWTNDRLLYWSIRSRFVRFMFKIGEGIRILPRGYSRFDSIFVGGTVRLIVEGGKMGVLEGSRLMLFRKPAL